MIPNALPLGLTENPRLDQWIGFPAPGKVLIKTGKVELGQGILTALLQIAADELDVAPSRIELHSGDTTSTPREGFTAGSLSVENSGGSIRLVAAEVRALMIEAAAHALNCPSSELTVTDGMIARQGDATPLDYWQLAPALDLAQAASGRIAPKSGSARRLIGTSLPRVDLAAKIFGEGRPFIHDMTADDLIHCRVIHQPWQDAVLADETALLERIAGAGVRIIRVENFLAIGGPSENGVDRALARLLPQVTWTGGHPMHENQHAPRWIATQPTLDTTTTRGQPAASPGGARRLRHTYSKPFIAHASIGPSCALARFSGGRLSVWTHSQGVFPLRDSLARTLALDATQIDVRHVQGAGCYGHNGADDAACDAAIIARHWPDATIRVLWTRADELTAAPCGTAMIVALDAALADDGRPLDWTTEIWTGSHAQRPGAFGGINLLGAEASLTPPPVRPVPQEIPAAAGGSGARNAWLLYDVPHQTIVNRIIPNLPQRTSSMRGLGAFANVFAIESFIDELALGAGIDPVNYRLAMTSDPRARDVMEKAVAMAAWDLEKAPGDGRGFAYSRYKNRAGYLAVFVDVHVDAEVRLKRVWCAVDAGLVINPDGVRNQVEGGLLQAASWTLKEQLTFAHGAIANRTWDEYPILRFSEVPEIDIALMDRPDEPTLGVGEVAQGPMAAAIANAVADALGLRMRDLPLTRDRIIAAVNG